MPDYILTHLKIELKKLDRLLTIPYFWGPLLTVVFTVAYHYGSLATGYSIAVGWLWLALIISVFVAGLRAGLVCAAWIAGYAYYANGEDLTLLAQRVVVTFLIALLVGWLKGQLRQEWETARINEAKARALDELNGNLERLRRTEKVISDLILGWGVLSDKVRYDSIRNIHHDLAHLVSITEGWHQLYRERQEVLRDFESAQRSGDP